MHLSYFCLRIYTQIHLVCIFQLNSIYVCSAHWSAKQHIRYSSVKKETKTDTSSRNKAKEKTTNKCKQKCIWTRLHRHCVNCTRAFIRVDIFYVFAHIVCVIAMAWCVWHEGKDSNRLRVGRSSTTHQTDRSSSLFFSLCMFSFLLLLLLLLFLPLLLRLLPSLLLLFSRA